MMDDSLKQILHRTKTAFIWARLLGVPFWGMIYLLTFILYKDLHVTPLQITLVITLKPLSALFAPYWSQWIYKRPDRIISNLAWSNILRYLPFLFAPWIESSWTLIAAFGFYMMFYRGVIPTWMEMVKRNLPSLAQQQLVGYGSAIDYGGTALLPFILGPILDNYSHAWQWLFPFTAGLGLLSTFFIYRIPIDRRRQDVPESHLILSSKERLLLPWKNSWKLIKENTSFSKFQVGFMLGGAGLMIIQPALPIFFIDVLALSYTKMLLALTLFKGLSFALAMPVWVKLFRRWDIFYFSGIVTVLAALFPLLLLSAQLHMFFLYLAYALYGVMQAGSDLSWNLSGPYFAKEEDSTFFSGTNVFAVGVRGCIIPPLGSLLYSLTNSTTVIVVGSTLCLLATRYLLNYGLVRRNAATREESISSRRL